ncbi:MAG: hypothetical protein ACLQU5_24265 [Isosphaeraceae bacterium]
MPTESQQPAKFRASVEDRFRRVAMEPDRERKFPVGPESAKRLGYGCGEVDALPSSLTESFRGAGNPAHRARTTGRPVRAVLRYAGSRATSLRALGSTELGCGVQCLDDGEFDDA